MQIDHMNPLKTGNNTENKRSSIWQLFFVITGGTISCYYDNLWWYTSEDKVVKLTTLCFQWISPQQNKAP